ncbi:DUF3592 domain-containing protein [Myxococcota bacterium]|nr:DUF3592 domain-containing protein [Myxococcota bacterium]MBU1382232.1 DUF3592 domain-containing protein [Myxococcota bacterium]MBU1495683.1 DUF3592 domain-containing protein [Myxococcota bacterium]
MKLEAKKKYEEEETKRRIERKDDERKTTKEFRKFYFSLILGGLVMVAGIIVHSIHPDWTKTTGEITDIKYKYSGGKNTRHFVQIKYRYLPPDKPDFVTSDKWCFPSSFKKYGKKIKAMKFMSTIKKGDLIKVWYNPDNNIKSTCNMKTQVKHPKTAYGLFGFAFFICMLSVVWFVYFSNRKRRNKKPTPSG